MAIDTLREEGSATEDDNNDFERYVDPPAELQDPDLSQAAQVNRQQEQETPGQDEGGGPPQGPQQQYMTLQIPVPAQGAPQVPMQNFVPPQPAQDPAMAPQGAPQGQPQPQQPPITAAVLDYFDGYYGRRVANWLDAIEAGRDMNPAEAADYQRQTANLSTLENSRDLSTTNRNPRKGTANMARTNMASRSKTAQAGRRQHFAEGHLGRGGGGGRNDQ